VVIGSVKTRLTYRKSCRPPSSDTSKRAAIRCKSPTPWIPWVAFGVAPSSFSRPAASSSLCGVASSLSPGAREEGAKNEDPTPFTLTTHPDHSPPSGSPPLRVASSFSLGARCGGVNGVALGSHLLLSPGPERAIELRSRLDRSSCRIPTLCVVVLPLRGRIFSFSWRERGRGEKRRSDPIHPENEDPTPSRPTQLSIATRHVHA
jgi:hypothetical protein